MHFLIIWHLSDIAQGCNIFLNKCDWILVHEPHMNGWMDRESTPIWQMMATKAFHTSQHVTGPPNKAQASLSAACSSQEDAARDQPGSTACLCCCNDPVESGQHGLPAAAPALPVSEARRQTPCMPAWHSWETRRARRGRGREAAAWGGGHGGRVGEVDMVKEAGGRTDRRRHGGEDRLWKKPATLKKTVEENRWRAWQLVSCERGGSMPKKTDSRAWRVQSNGRFLPSMSNFIKQSGRREMKS